MSKPIYLDYNATTPLDPRVLEAMLPYLRDEFGNAASRGHAYGWVANEAVEQARHQAADLLNAQPVEIIWTSGATESNNLAIIGTALAHQHRGRHIITQATEHPALLDPCHVLQRQGFEITVLPVDRHGLISIEQLEAVRTTGTILVSIMSANNETGTLQPLHEIGQWCRQQEIIFHSDATQAFGKIPLDVEALSLDLLSASGHKIYGPKGVGLLYLRRQPRRIRCEPLLHGGGHERGVRSGTLNVPGIVGLGCAAEIARREMQLDATRISALRDRLWQQLQPLHPQLQLNGHPERRLPNTLNITIAGVDGENLMTALPQLAFSSGSACTSANQQLSHVLQAMGRTPEQTRSSIRLSLGRFTIVEEIDTAARLLTGGAEKLFKINPP
ncbi:MAG: Cysteine desulfurase IscS [Phycisphaerae bacterium]|nr:Cysteine desulfurase IscS [Phycisphaerae bacterium]